MKILQVSIAYYPLLGGIAEHVKSISERLARQHQVTVFTCNYSGKLPEEEMINDVLVRRFKTFSSSGAYHLSLEMAKALRKSNFDIVHGHNYHAFPLYFSQYAKRRKFVVTPHYHGHGHTWLRNFLIKLYQPLGKRIFVEADSIIAVSNYEKGLLVNDFGIDQAKISVIPNGVDLAEFSISEKIKMEPKIILYVGRLEKYKGIQYIIEAMPLLDKEFSLTIVGKGSYKEKLVRLIDKIGITNRVKFYQDLPRRELLKRYAEASVFVLLSQHEAFSLAVAEALASKTPCLVASTSALSEWVDNKNCFGIDYPISNDRLAELINKVAGITVGDINLWNWDEVVKNIVRVYEE